MAKTRKETDIVFVLSSFRVLVIDFFWIWFDPVLFLRSLKLIHSG